MTSFPSPLTHVTPLSVEYCIVAVIPEITPVAELAEGCVTEQAGAVGLADSIMLCGRLSEVVVILPTFTRDIAVPNHSLEIAISPFAFDVTLPLFKR